MMNIFKILQIKCKKQNFSQIEFKKNNKVVFKPMVSTKL